MNIKKLNERLSALLENYNDNIEFQKFTVTHYDENDEVLENQGCDSLEDALNVFKEFGTTFNDGNVSLSNKQNNEYTALLNIDCKNKQLF